MSIVIGVIYPWMVNNPKSSAILILGVIVLFYFMFAPQGKQYCYARIREKRGEVFYDHQTLYKCAIKSQLDGESGRKVYWLQIGTRNLFGTKFLRFWKVPKSEDLLPTIKGKRLIELAWFGGNNFQLIKVNSAVYHPVNSELYHKNKDGEIVKVRETTLYKKKNLNQYALDIIPEDLKLLDYELDIKIDKFMKNTNLWQLIDKYAVIALVAFICFGMVYMTSKSMSEAMGDVSEDIEGVGNKMVNYFESARQEEKGSGTTVVDTDEGGG